MDLIENPDIQAILLSILCGSIIGFEREYRNKSAGFRTVVLICFGATIFTVVSRMGNLSDDRIAANIVTGIGFLGAGVIFKGKVSVQGLTTAAVIWTIAAIGMLIGYGEFELALVSTALMLIVLALFHQLEKGLANVYSIRTIHVTFQDTQQANLSDFEAVISKYKIRSNRKGVGKENNQISATYEISGSIQRIRRLNNVILSLDYVTSFYNA